MSDDEVKEIEAVAEEAPKAEEAPAPKKRRKAKSKMVACTILRDFWDENGVRHCKGTGIEVTPDEAMDGLENGTLERVKK